MFNGFQKVYGLCSLVKWLAKFGERANHRQRKTAHHTCSDLFKPVQNFSHQFPSVPTSSHLFTLVHTFSHLFTPAHTSVTIYALHGMGVSTLFAQGKFLVEFSLCPNLSVAVRACPICSDHVRLSRNVIFLHFRKLLLKIKIKIKIAVICFLANPAKTAYFSV